MGGRPKPRDLAERMGRRHAQFTGSICTLDSSQSYGRIGLLLSHYQRCAGNENFPGIPVPIPGIPGNSGNGNEKSQNLHNSRNSPFPGNGNQFNWESRDSPAGNKIPFFIYQISIFWIINILSKIFIKERKTVWFLL